MSKEYEILIIVGMCGLVLLIGVLRKKTEWLINFVLRAVFGTILMYFMNQLLITQGFSWHIGINPLTVLTSGILGFPGLAALYGISLYASL